MEVIVDQAVPNQTLILHEWQADLRAGRLVRAGETRSVEPKVMDLLFLLAGEPHRVFSRDEILQSLWPHVTVGEDTLSRCVFKLRRALDDDPHAPRFIETVSKRGYRLIVDPAAHAREGDALVRRAGEFYFQFTRTDNEAAIALYERAIAVNPDDVAALAGLANGFVQRAVRWLDVGDGVPARSTLRQALDSGILSSPEALEILVRAQIFAERAVAMAAQNAVTLKALGFVMAASQRFDEARALYIRALAADPTAWGVLINLADLDDLEGHAAEALQNLERAFAVMTGVYHDEVALVRPWYAALGTLIADRHAALGQSGDAQDWYRRVLNYSPVNEAATAGLARLLVDAGDAAAARQLCAELIARIGPSTTCANFVGAAD